MIKRRRRSQTTIEEAEVLSNLCHLEQNTVVVISKRCHLDRNKLIGISNFCHLERNKISGISKLGHLERNKISGEADGLVQSKDPNPVISANATSGSSPRDVDVFASIERVRGGARSYKALRLHRT